MILKNVDSRYLKNQIESQEKKLKDLKFIKVKGQVEAYLKELKKELESREK